MLCDIQVLFIEIVFSVGYNLEVVFVCVFYCEYGVLFGWFCIVVKDQINVVVVKMDW